MAESLNSVAESLGLGADPFRATATGSNAGSVSIKSHDELLSRIIDDAFYGRPLIAVTGQKGSGKSSLLRRLVSQFAGEAESITLTAEDFRDRDAFLRVIVSKLSPDALDYAADSPLLTIADYAGSLADQERLLLLVVDEAESLRPEFLDVLYELGDEADEASLCCVLVGEASPADVIESADPEGGVEDFTWFELEPLNAEETVDYVAAKLAAGGYAGPLPFADAQLAQIAAASGGLLAEINAAASDALAQPQAAQAPSRAEFEPVDPEQDLLDEPEYQAPLELGADADEFSYVDEDGGPEAETEEEFDDAVPEAASAALVAADPAAESETSPDAFTESASHASAELFSDTSSEPVVEISPEPLAETSSEPVSDRSPEPLFEPIPEPISDPISESIPEPISEPSSDTSSESEYEEELEPQDDEDEFDRDIDDWLEPDERPSIGAAAYGGEELEFDFDEEVDLDNASARGEGGGLRDGAMRSLAAVQALLRALPARLAAARAYWLSAAGLLVLFLAVIVFWRIPDEPQGGTIALSQPLASQGSSPASPTSSSSSSSVSPQLASRSVPAPPRPSSIASEPASRTAAAAQPAPLVQRSSAAVSAQEPATPSATPAPVRPAAQDTAATDTARDRVAAAAASSGGNAPAAAQSERGNAFERALLGASSQSYTLQILGAASEANVQEFIARNSSGLRQTLGYYRSTRAGEPWYVVSYGVFTDRGDAEATLRRLPAALSASGPWVRQLAGIQAEIRASR